jgi:hypothetical protein
MLLVFLFTSTAFSQKFTLHGYVNDKENGEALIGANVILKGTTSGTVTNVYGFYSLSLEAGDYTIVYSYIGFDDVEKEIDLRSDISLTIELSPASESIEEVVVSAEAKNQNIVSTQMGVEKLQSKTIEKIPVLLGEADVIKALKLLPGIVSTSEMSSNLSVRGGAYDQNMIMLDEASVYNASHLLGLFSVFNNDAIKSVELYKGMIPAQYGGRISSVVDIRMREGNQKGLSGVGSVGLLTSRLTLEAPIIKGKAAILMSGRRTYIDLLTKAISKGNQASEVPYYFYDYNLKANYTINDKHRVYLSGYFGRDVADMSLSDDNSQKTYWGNYTATFRWNYMISNKLFSNLTLLASDYDYLIESKSTYGQNKEKTQNLKWDAFLKDYSFKLDFNYYLNPQNSVKFGVFTIYHDFNIGDINGNIDTVYYNFSIPKNYSLEHAAYISNQQKLGQKIVLEYGLRISLLQNMGKATIYGIKNYEVVDTNQYKRREVFNTYSGLEPRFSSTFIINEHNSVKVGYSRTVQYLHVASNSNSGTPLDVWMPVSPYVKPQYAHQFAVGLFSNFFDNKLQTSVEGYYKKMNNQIDFKEFSNPYFNPQIEADFRFGIGRAYGLEFMLKKPDGRFSGWLSYTLSKSERKIKDIQEKDWFLSPYDHTHNISVVGMFDITKRLSVSGNWVYLTGQPFDSPSARWEYGNLILPYYNGKNTSRYPDYNRLDLGLELKNKSKSRFESSWTFSVYNVYNQRNPNVIYFEASGNNNTQAYRMSMLQRIYSVSFNFKF